MVLHQHKFDVVRSHLDMVSDGDDGRCTSVKKGICDKRCPSILEKFLWGRRSQSCEDI